MRVVIQPLCSLLVWLLLVVGPCYRADPHVTAAPTTSIVPTQSFPLAGQRNVKGNRDGIGLDARFGHFITSLTPAFPTNTSSSIYYLSDANANNHIKRLDGVTGQVVTLPGHLVAPYPAPEALTQHPATLAVTSDGGLVACVPEAHCLKRYDPRTWEWTCLDLVFPDPMTSDLSLLFPHQLLADGLHQFLVSDASGALKRLQLSSDDPPYKATVTRVTGHPTRLGRVDGAFTVATLGPHTLLARDPLESLSTLHAPSRLYLGDNGPPPFAAASLRTLHQGIVTTLVTFNATLGPISALAVAPGGQTLYVGFTTGQVYVWDLTQPSQPWTLLATYSTAVTALVVQAVAAPVLQLLTAVAFTNAIVQVTCRGQRIGPACAFVVPSAYRCNVTAPVMFDPTTGDVQACDRCHGDMYYGKRCEMPFYLTSESTCHASGILTFDRLSGSITGCSLCVEGYTGTRCDERVALSPAVVLHPLQSCWGVVVLTSVWLLQGLMR